MLTNDAQKLVVGLAVPMLKNAQTMTVSTIESLEETLRLCPSEENARIVKACSDELTRITCTLGEVAANLEE